MIAFGAASGDTPDASGPAFGGRAASSGMRGSTTPFRGGVVQEKKKPREMSRQKPKHLCISFYRYKM
jgi:hypothetical protein